jgi:sarcosine oxidase
MHDVAIVGLGAMGSAAAFELARRGVRLIGFDRFTPPHAFGSSHGESRIIREAYFEHPVYVPMVQRAFDRWGELERLAGRRLLTQTGGLMIGRPDSALVQGARRSAELHRLPHDVLTADALRERFPALLPERDMVGVWEPRAGALAPEACIAAFLDEAVRHGAELRFDEPVLRWDGAGRDVLVVTANGTWRARRVIVTAGAWVASLVPSSRLPVRVERQVLHWFEPSPDDAALFAPARCPIHLWQFDDGRFFYGFPELGSGVKMAFHHEGEPTTAGTVRRDVRDDERDMLRAVVSRFVPRAGGRVRASSVCLYTNTPDDHFWIDRDADDPKVLIASACSGHGFKFAPVIGEILADLVQDRAPRFDLALFRRRG